MEGTAEFFTLATLGTLTGAATATLLVGNVFGFMFNSSPRLQKAAALIFAVVISFFVFVYSVDDRGGSDYLIMLLNGLLIFATAYGLNETTTATGSWD
jgi:hypothetical protein